jgi:lipopolysaccharide transport system permease protein
MTETENVYTSESSLRHPAHLLRQMGRDFMASHDLARRLLVRDINAQYRQSFLGIIWAFVPPVAMAVGFTLARQSNVLNIGETTLPYPAYIMFSMTLWQTFVEAMMGPVQAISSAKPMLVRIKFPCEAIVLSKLGEVCFNFAIKLVLIIGLFLWYSMPVTGMVLLAPLALLSLIVLGTALGLFLAPISALYQDISKGLTLLTGIWFFLTPVVYPVPTGDSWGALLVRWNPVTPLLVTTRELATTGVVSSLHQFLLVSALNVVALLLAWLFYRLAMPFVVERMSS